MRFIVDESTGQAVVDFLRDAGHDVIGVGEAMPQADDQEVLRRATADERIIVTNDKDFGELVFRSRQAHRGVVLLRLRDESSANRVRVVRMIVEQFPDRLADHFTVATESRLRIRPV